MTAMHPRRTRAKRAVFQLGLATVFTVLLATPGGVATASSPVTRDQAGTVTERVGALEIEQAAPAAVVENSRTPATRAGFPDPVKLAKCIASVTVAFVPAAGPVACAFRKRLGGNMSTLNVQNRGHGDTTRHIAWLTFFGAFVFGLVAFAVVREARVTTDVVIPAAIAMLVGLAYDRFVVHLEAGRLVGVILTVIAFAGGAATGLLLPT